MKQQEKFEQFRRQDAVIHCKTHIEMVNFLCHCDTDDNLILSDELASYQQYHDIYKIYKEKTGFFVMYISPNGKRYIDLVNIKDMDESAIIPWEE